MKRFDVPPDRRRSLHEHRDWILELADLGYTDLWSSEAGGHDGFTLALAAAWAPRCASGSRSSRPSRAAPPSWLRARRASPGRHPVAS